MKEVTISLSVKGNAEMFTAKGKDKKTCALAVKSALEKLDDTLDNDEIQFNASGTLDNGEVRAIATDSINEAMNWLEENK